MNKPEFQNLPLYTYRGGQINLIQYCNTYEGGSGSGPCPYNERLIPSFSAPGTNGIQLQDSVDINAADFANQSMLARDMKNSLGKTFAVFTSVSVNAPTIPAQYTGVSNDTSVGQFQNGNLFVDVQTFSALVPAANEFTILTITSFLNNVRT